MLLLNLMLGASIIYLVIIYMEWDRVIGFKFWSYESFAKGYANKPLAHPTRRVVISYVDDGGGIPSDTFKSLLDQSVKVTDIVVQTDDQQKFDSVKSFTTIFSPGALSIIEGDDSTILIPVESKIYPYDFVEQTVAAVEPIVPKTIKDKARQTDALRPTFEKLFR